MRHIVENESKQAEVTVNTSVDFNSPPTVEIELEDAIYASGMDNSAGIKALLETEDLAPVAKVLVEIGRYEKSRVAAAAK